MLDSPCPSWHQKRMNVLVACEFSGAVRNAFRARGHNAWSCDLEPAEDGSPFHVQMDVLSLLAITPPNAYDLLIAFPPCTHLAVSGARWFRFKRDEQAEAIRFAKMLWHTPIRRIALENPVGILSRHIGSPAQVIQPWQFGHGETKATCLWLKNLPPLEPTKVVSGRVARVHRMPPGPNRARERSRTYAGIAEAMADQWGRLLDAPFDLVDMMECA